MASPIDELLEIIYRHGRAPPGGRPRNYERGPRYVGINLLLTPDPRRTGSRADGRLQPKRRWVNVEARE